MGEIHYVLDLLKADPTYVDEDSIETLASLLEESKTLGLNAQVNTYRTLLAEKKYLTVDLVGLTRLDDLPCVLINPDTKTVKVKTRLSNWFGDGHEFFKEETKRDLDAKHFYILPAASFKPRMPLQIMKMIASREFESYHVGVYTSPKNLGDYYEPQRVDPVLFGFNGETPPGIIPYWRGTQRVYAISIWGEDLNCEELHSSLKTSEKRRENNE